VHRRVLVGSVLLVTVVGCTNGSDTATAPELSEPVQATEVPFVASDGCDGPSPTQWDDVGTVHTIVPQPDSDLVDVAVVSPGRLCSGAHARFEITVTNTSDHAITFKPNRGLLLMSDGMANWELGNIHPIEMQSGGVYVFVVDATIPNVRPGTYGVRPEGYRGGQLEIVLPPVDSGLLPEGLRHVSGGVSPDHDAEYEVTFTDDQFVEGSTSYQIVLVGLDGRQLVATGDRSPIRFPVDLSNGAPCVTIVALNDNSEPREATICIHAA
jgi:hypothetical protein